MTIRVGTIVTRYEPGELDDHGYRLCDADILDVCIGIVTEADDIEYIGVHWLKMCRWHKGRETVIYLECDRMWEIGQLG